MRYFKCTIIIFKLNFYLIKIIIKIKFLMVNFYIKRVMGKYKNHKNNNEIKDD